MKIEKINNNKLKIILDIEDLKNNNIDLNSFMANSKTSQQLLLTLLDYAEKEFDFITNNYDIKIETFYINNGNFIINITRLKQTTSSRVTAKIKNPSTNLSSTVYIFSSIDDFLNFYSKLASSLNLITLSDCKFSLYRYKNFYFLVISYDCLNTVYNMKLKCILSEFSNTIDFSFFENIKEYCSLICYEKIFT